MASGTKDNGLGTHAKYSEDYEKDDLEEMPITVIGDLEQYQFSSPEGVHDLKVRSNSDARDWRRWRLTHRKRHCRHKCTEETPPEGLDAKVVAHFLRVFNDAPCGR